MKFHIFFKKCSLFSIDSKNKYLVCCFGWEQCCDCDGVKVSIVRVACCGTFLSVCFSALVSWTKGLFWRGKNSHKIPKFMFLQNPIYHKTYHSFCKCDAVCNGKDVSLIGCCVFEFCCFYGDGLAEKYYSYLFIFDRNVYKAVNWYTTHTSLVLSAANFLVTVLWRCLSFDFLFSPFCLFYHN